MTEQTTIEMEQTPHTVYPSGTYVPYTPIKTVTTSTDDRPRMQFVYTPMENPLHMERTGYDYKKLTGFHHEILRMLARGYTNIEVAEALGCAKETVSTLKRSPLGAEVLEHLIQEAAEGTVFDMVEHSRRLLPKSARLLEDIINGDIEGVTPALRAKYANAHLARMGYGEIHKSHNVTAHVPPTEIAEWRKRKDAIKAEMAAMDPDLQP